jgi:hypothetical protein
MEKMVKTKMDMIMEVKAEIKTGTIKNTLPKITKQEILEAKENTWDFFFLLLSKYYELMDGQYDETENEFNTAQHTLMAYNILYGEVTNGGYLSLIQNGYGGYIFETLFSETMKVWGIKEMAINIDKAKEIYLVHKPFLEMERTEEQFSRMYQEFPHFNSIDKDFFKIMDDESEKIKIHIQENMSDFATAI